MILCTLLALVAQDPVPLQDLTPIQASTRQPVRQEPMLVRSYNVWDLVGQGELLALENDLIKRVDQTDADAESVRREFAAFEAARSTAANALADIQSIMKANLEPAFDGKRHLLEALPGGRLLLLGSPEQHAWTRSYLDSCREFKGLIHVTAEIVSLPAGSLNQIMEERSGQVIAKAAADSLLLEAKSIVDAEIVQVSTMAIPPFRKATMVNVNQVAYIQDFELLVLPDAGKEIVDPVVAVVQEGTEMEVSVTPIESGRFSLDAHLTHSVLERPIKTFDMSIGPDKLKVQVQLPEVIISRLKGKFDLGLEEALVITSKQPDGEQELLMLMSVRAVTEQDR